MMSLQCVKHTCNFEFDQALCIKNIQMFQNVFSFGNHVKLQFTVLILLTKFIISRLLYYNSLKLCCYTESLQFVYRICLRSS